MRLEVRKVDKENFHLIRNGDENDGQNYWNISVKNLTKCLESLENILREKIKDEPEAKESVDESSQSS